MAKSESIKRVNHLLDIVESSGHLESPVELAILFRSVDANIKLFEKATNQDLTNQHPLDVSIVNTEYWRALRKQIGETPDLTTKFTASKTSHTHQAKSGSIAIVLPDEHDHPQVAISKGGRDWIYTYEPADTAILIENMALITHFNESKNFINTVFTELSSKPYDLIYTAGWSGITDENTHLYSKYAEVYSIFDPDLGGSKQCQALAKRLNDLGPKLEFLFPDNLPELLSEFGHNLDRADLNKWSKHVEQLQGVDHLTQSQMNSLQKMLTQSIAARRCVEQETYLIPFITDL